ncbi:hypothetical protein [Spirosoma sp. 209]|uniref:hypothetical protein n=1 Tax=Spirosoma sp. 209 TaxID=1955701 RepID=UPI001115DE18|nr:hypothetical protein [Spirosoma sp. 209]
METKVVARRIAPQMLSQTTRQTTLVWLDFARVWERVVPADSPFYAQGYRIVSRWELGDIQVNIYTLNIGDLADKAVLVGSSAPIDTIGQLHAIIYSGQ